MTIQFKKLERQPKKNLQDIISSMTKLNRRLDQILRNVEEIKLGYQRGRINKI